MWQMVPIVRRRRRESIRVIDWSVQRRTATFLMAATIRDRDRSRVGLANSMTWQLSGPDTTDRDYGPRFFIDPTSSSRWRTRCDYGTIDACRTDLLQNVRSFQRYKTGFYLTVTTGRQCGTRAHTPRVAYSAERAWKLHCIGWRVGTVGNVQQRNAANARALVEEAQCRTSVEFSSDSGPVTNSATPPKTFLASKNNLLRFEDSLREQLTKSLRSRHDPTQQLQVAQARQALVSAQAQWLATRTNYETTLDNFKTVLGLPPYLMR